MVVREILPGRAAGAVVLAHRAPLTLGEIRPPSFPVRSARCGCFQALLFRGQSSFAHLSKLSRARPSPDVPGSFGRGLLHGRVVMKTSNLPRAWRNLAHGASRHGSV